MASFVFILNSYHRKIPIKLKVQLIWERLSYWSLKAYMRMFKGIIVLINCGSLLLNSAKKTALKWAFLLSPSFLMMHKKYYQYQTNTSHNINCNCCVCVSHLRNNLSPNSCMFGLLWWCSKIRLLWWQIIITWSWTSHAWIYYILQ